MADRNTETRAMRAIQRSLDSGSLVDMDDGPGLHRVLYLVCDDHDTPDYWGSDSAGNLWHVKVMI